MLPGTQKEKVGQCSQVVTQVGKESSAQGKHRRERCRRDSGCVEKKAHDRLKAKEGVSRQKRGLNSLPIHLPEVTKCARCCIQCLKVVSGESALLPIHNFIPILYLNVQSLVRDVLYQKTKSTASVSKNVSLTEVEQPPWSNADGTKTDWSYYVFRIMSVLVLWQCTVQWQMFFILPGIEVSLS